MYKQRKIKRGKEEKKGGKGGGRVEKKRRNEHQAHFVSSLPLLGQVFSDFSFYGDKT